MNLKKLCCICLGTLSLALGAVGALIPVLPTVPFLMLSAFCFARSSEKLHRWFVGTKLYQDNLADFASGKGMTRKTKVRIMVTVTCLMTMGFILMQAVPVGRIVLCCVWLFHVLYFIFGIPTLTHADKEAHPYEETVESCAAH